MLHYSCQCNHFINSSIELYLEDNPVVANVIRELQIRWVKKRRQKETEANFTVKNLGITCLIYTMCSRCEKMEWVSPRTSKYANTNMKGEVSSKRNRRRYDLSVKFCIGTLTCSLGVQTYLSCSPLLVSLKRSHYIRVQHLFTNIELEKL